MPPVPSPIKCKDCKILEKRHERAVNLQRKEDIKEKKRKTTQEKRGDLMREREGLALVHDFSFLSLSVTVAFYVSFQYPIKFEPIASISRKEWSPLVKEVGGES